MCGPSKDLVLGAASQSGQRLEDSFVVRRESPWETFVKVYECELAGRFDMAIPRVRPRRLVAVRTIQGKSVDETLQRFKDIQHPNILSSKECFVDGELVFMLHDDISVSLEHIVACEAYLDEVELAAILAQVSSSPTIDKGANGHPKILDGLLYLTNQRVEHPYLNSPTSLYRTRGSKNRYVVSYSV